MFWGNSGEFWGNQTKSFSLVFTRFHSFFQVKNTFPSWGNLIPLISSVATVKTGEIFGEKCGREFSGKREFAFSFILFPLPHDQFQLQSTVYYNIVNVNVFQIELIVLSQHWKLCCTAMTTGCTVYAGSRG